MPLAIPSPNVMVTLASLEVADALHFAASVAPEKVAVQLAPLSSLRFQTPPSAPKLESSVDARVMVTCRLRLGRPDGTEPTPEQPPVMASARTEPMQLPLPGPWIIQSPPSANGSAPKST